MAAASDEGAVAVVFLFMNLPEHFGRIAASYDTGAEFEEARHRTTHQQEFSFATTLLSRHIGPSDHRVIDLGSGPGAFALWLARSGRTVRLVDVSKRSLQLAKLLFEQAGLCDNFSSSCSHAADLSGEFENDFDVALLLGTVYHSPDSNYVTSVCREVNRVLIDSGLFVVNFANPSHVLAKVATNKAANVADALSHQLKTAGWTVYHDETHRPGCWLCTPEYMEDLISNCGFVIVEKAAQGSLCWFIARSATNPRSHAAI